MPNIKMEVPFNLLERCKVTSDGYYHEESCFCHGSGVMPTNEGYEVIGLLRWVLNFSPNRLSDLSCATLQEALDYINKEHVRRKEREDLRRKQRFSQKEQKGKHGNES